MVRNRGAAPLHHAIGANEGAETGFATREASSRRPSMRPRGEGASMWTLRTGQSPPNRMPPAPRLSSAKDRTARGVLWPPVLLFHPDASRAANGLRLHCVHDPVTQRIAEGTLRYIQLRATTFSVPHRPTHPQSARPFLPGLSSTK